MGKAPPRGVGRASAASPSLREPTNSSSFGVQLPHTLCSRGISPCMCLQNKDVALKMPLADCSGHEPHPCRAVLSIPASGSLRRGACSRLPKGHPFAPATSRPAASAGLTHLFYLVESNCSKETANVWCLFLQLPSQQQKSRPRPTGLQKAACRSSRRSYREHKQTPR